MLLDAGVTVNIPARPEFNSAEFEQTRIWNTLARFDHQINASHTWGVRYLVETSPQFNQLESENNWTKAAAESEEDLDWTAVWTMNSVLSSRAVNTVRLSATREDVFFGNPAFFENGKVQETLGPTFNHPGFVDRQSPRANRSLDAAYQLDESFAFFLPDRWGTHDFKTGAQVRLRSVNGTMEVPRTRGLKFSGVFRANSGTPFTITDSSTDPDRNGLFQEPLPASTYSGRGLNAITVESDGRLRGARGPGYLQLDLRAGYRFQVGRRSLDLFVDALNVTNRSNYFNPGGRRAPQQLPRGHGAAGERPDAHGATGDALRVLEQVGRVGRAGCLAVARTT